MRKVIMLLSLMFFTVFSVNLEAQESKNELVSVYFKTNMSCHECEQTLFNHLKFEKGIKDLKVDLKTNSIKVSYKSGKNTNEKIAGSINKKGYEAQPLTEKEYNKIINEKTE